MPDSTSHEEKERAAEMDAEIVTLRGQRVPFEEIGRRMHAKYGRIGATMPREDPDRPFSKQYMHERYITALDRVPARAVANHRAELGALLNQVIDEAYAIAQKDHLAHSNGRVVEVPDENGRAVPVLDDGPKLAALAEVRKAAVEVMRLFGLAVPVKVETSSDVTVNYTINGVDPEALK